MAYGVGCGRSAHLGIRCVLECVEDLLQGDCRAGALVDRPPHNPVSLMNTAPNCQFLSETTLRVYDSTVDTMDSPHNAPLSPVSAVSHISEGRACQSPRSWLILRGCAPPGRLRFRSFTSTACLTFPLFPRSGTLVLPCGEPHRRTTKQFHGTAVSRQSHSSNRAAEPRNETPRQLGAHNNLPAPQT